MANMAISYCWLMVTQPDQFFILKE